MDNPIKHARRIVRNLDVCGGDPVFRGTRVTLRTVLASLAEGDNSEEIHTQFPSLSADDIHSAIKFAAASALGHISVPAIPRFDEYQE